MWNGSNWTARRLSPRDIQVVQNLIEWCLHLYMDRGEVAATLLAHAKIEPGFTELIWQKLEEQNREFFEAYYLRLAVKNQIAEYNKLLDQQLQLMQQINSSVPSMPISSGSHDTPLHQNSPCYTPEHMVPAVNHAADSRLQNALSNGGSSLVPSVHSTVGMSLHASGLDVNAMIPVQSSNMSSIQGLNGSTMRSETGYSVASPDMFSPHGNVFGAHPPVDTTPPSFTSLGFDSRDWPVLFLGSHRSELGQLVAEFPRTLSLSDLAADFAQRSDILENYSRPNIQGTENENFVDPQERENQGDTHMRISNGMS